MEGSSPFRDPVPGRRGSAGHWFARVGLGVVPFVTVGLLGWVPVLIAAVRTRKVVDWSVFVIAAAGALFGLIFLGIATESDDAEKRREAAGLPEPQTVLDDVGIIMLMVLMFGVPIWWFVRTSRRGVGAPRRPAPYGPWQPQPIGYRTGPPGVGYPNPRPPTRTSGSGPGHAGPPIPRAAPTPVPRPVPPPPPPAPDDPAARARARLAGLSERMREEDGDDRAGNARGPR